MGVRVLVDAEALDRPVAVTITTSGFALALRVRASSADFSASDLLSDTGSVSAIAPDDVTAPASRNTGTTPVTEREILIATLLPA